MKKKNILFILTDDQRFDTIGILGNNEIHTPHIDSLVKRGVAFTNAHIPGGTVGAVCMPSRAMINTGRTLFHLTDCGQRVAPEHALLGETLKRSGYHTYGIGKWHNSPEAYARSFCDGDNIFFGGMDDHWNVPCYHYDPTGEYGTRYRRTTNPHYSNENDTVISDHCSHGKHSTDLFADTAIDFLHSYKGDDPFYLYLAFMAPHDPRTMPQKYLDMYDPEKITLPENFMGLHPFMYGVEKIRDEVLAPYPRTEEDTRRQLCEYYAMISHLDDRIGDVIQALKDRGEYDDTYIVLAGDNGLALGQHGLFGKQSCYDHSVRIPLLISGPGIGENRVNDSFVFLYDIFPTLMDLCGLDIPSTVEGKSLVPCLKDEKAELRDEIFLYYGDLVRAVKNRKWKYIEYHHNGEVHRQLFDLVNDPKELNSVLVENPRVAEVMYQHMVENSRKMGDMDDSIGSGFWSCVK